MKKFLKKILVLWFISFGWFVLAQNSFDPMNMPKLQQYVSDFSNSLNQSELNDLNTSFQNYDQQTTNQFVAVLFPNRNWYELFDIGMKIFNENQIGQAWKNNWLLMLVSTEEKKIRIVVWYWLEWDLPDALVKRIIEEDIRPLINSWDLAWAINAFYQRSSDAIANNEASSMSNPMFSDWDKDDWLWIFGLILGFILASLIKKKKISKSIKKIWIPLIVAIIVGLILFLWLTLLIWIIAWLVFGFTGFLPGRGWWSFGWWWGGWGGFSWWGWSSGGWWAGD